MKVEFQPIPSGPKVELIQDGKIFSIRHAKGHLLASVAYSEFEAEALSRQMEKHSLSDANLSIHPVASALLITVGEGLKYYTLENPFRTGSKDSESVYVAVGMFEECIFLAQYKYPNSRSSWHWHLPGEHFSDRKGDSFKYRDDGQVSKLSAYKYVPPNEPHLIYTLDRPALNLILHEGTCLNHNPVTDRPKPSIEELRELTIRAGLYPPD